MSDENANSAPECHASAVKTNNPGVAVHRKPVFGSRTAERAIGAVLFRFVANQLVVLAN